MEQDELSQSSIQRFASYSHYLDQLSGMAGEMGLRQRSNLIHLERRLNELWSLGANSILSWAPVDEGVMVLIVPHYALAEYTAPNSNSQVSQKVSEHFLIDLISGKRQLKPEQMQKVARLLEIEPTLILLRQPLQGDEGEYDIIEKMIRRYGINYVASRAVTLFDIVGFSLLTPFEQMTQLNSLSYSLNSVHAKMLEQDIGINFARTSTGDGFYIWNRDQGLEANVNLYHFMHLVLADNAIARSKAIARVVPRLRACFHVGSCYEFHQAEGLNPTVHDFIVGDVTIELARMIDATLPGQIFVGEFLPDKFMQDSAHVETQSNLDAVRFLERAQGNLPKLSGLVLAGERVTAIKCYLTGEQLDNGNFSIRKLSIKDKHGLTRTVYNAKVNIYRAKGDPILLGIEDRVLAKQDCGDEK